MGYVGHACHFDCSVVDEWKKEYVIRVDEHGNEWLSDKEMVISRTYSGNQLWVLSNISGVNHLWVFIHKRQDNYIMFKGIHIDEGPMFYNVSKKMVDQVNLDNFQLFAKKWHARWKTAYEAKRKAHA